MHLPIIQRYTYTHRNLNYLLKQCDRSTAACCNRQPKREKIKITEYNTHASFVKNADTKKERKENVEIANVSNGKGVGGGGGSLNKLK